MVDWYYIFSILPLGVYPCSPDIYNVGDNGQDIVHRNNGHDIVQ
jgi:hypothetical protein